MCTVIDQMQKRLQRVKNNIRATRLRPVSYVFCFTRCDIMCGLLQYTRTEM